MDHLRQVLTRLQNANLKLKCHFLCHSTEYLGLKPNPKQVATVKEFPVPANVTQVQQFLGLASYYHRFVFCPHSITTPQSHTKNVPFQWTTACQLAFETLKKKLVSAPVLEYPDFDLPFLLKTDASVNTPVIVCA